MRRKTRRQFIPLLIAATFVGGAAVGWWARAWTSSAGFPSLTARPVATTSDVNLPAEPVKERAAGHEWPTSSPPAPAVTEIPSALDRLKQRHLHLPIDHADVEAMRGQFGDRREGGARGHEAVDIMAPRRTPVRAVDDGTIVKLFQSRAGGTTIYQFDPSERFCYYYAHLDSYAPGLHERQRVSRGDTIGFVGTSGNASANAPHLHFAIFELDAERHWWEGAPIDPYQAFVH